MKELIPFTKEIVFKNNIATITSISLEHEEKVFDGEVSGDFIIFGDYKVHNDTTEKELFRYRLPFTALLPENIIKDSVVIEVNDFTYEQILNDVLKVSIDFTISGDLKKEEVEVKKEDKILDKNEHIELLDNMEEKELIEAIERANNSSEVLVKDSDNFFKEAKEVKADDEDKNQNGIISGREEFKNEVLMAEKEKKDTLEKEVAEKVEKEEKKEEKKEKILEKVEDDEKQKREEVEECEEVETEIIKEVEETEFVTYHIHIVKENETLEEIIRLYDTTIDVIKEYNDIDNMKKGDKLIIPECLE